MKKKARKPKADEPSVRTAKCFLVSEQLTIALASTADAINETRHQKPRLRKAVDQAKRALLVASIISTPISRKVRSIVRDLKKEETRASANRAFTEARRRGIKLAIEDVHQKIWDLGMESARQCGAAGYRELDGLKILRELEKKAVAAIPLHSQRNVYGYAPDPEGLRPIYFPPKGGRR